MCIRLQIVPHGQQFRLYNKSQTITLSKVVGIYWEENNKNQRKELCRQNAEFVKYCSRLQIFYIYIYMYISGILSCNG
jgi:hypothetical protein